jgi:hypothetical protein
MSGSSSAAAAAPPPLVKQPSMDLETLEADDEFEEFESKTASYSFQ